MEDKLTLLNRLKEIRTEKKISQSALANMVGVSRNTVSSIETGQYSPTAKLAYSICIALDKKFEEVFFFDCFENACEKTIEKGTEDADASSLSDKAIQRIKDYMLKEGWDAEKILDLIIYIIK